MDECDSSDGSYDADDFLEDDEEIEFKSDEKWVLDKEIHGGEVVKDINSIRVHMFTFINFSDSISLRYVSEIMKVLLKTVEI